MGSGSRTIIRNNLETFGLTRLRGNLKIGMGSVDHNDVLANQTFTHFTSYFSPLVSKFRFSWIKLLYGLMTF